MIKVGLLGLGTVGSGVYEILKNKSEGIKRATGKSVEITKILDRDMNKIKEFGLAEGVLTDDADAILNDPDIDVIVEVLGGIDVPLDFIKRALKSGKHVVTANKAVISPYFEELHKLADENNVGLLYEASVAGGVPIIKELKSVLNINDVHNIKGILNGTTNFIMSKMYDENLTFEEALQEAHDNGYAEADPTDDIEGFDAARKISILASIAFGTHVAFSDVVCRGITSVTARDIKNFKEMHLAPKLIGSAVMKDGECSASVEPVLVDSDSPFASVKDAFNSVSITGDIVDELQFYGRGAGKNPTANAIVIDIIDILLGKHKEYSFTNNRDIKISGGKLFKGNYYLRISEEVASSKSDILALVDSFDFRYTVTHDEDDLIIYTKKLNSEVMESLIEKLDLPLDSFCYLRVES